MSPPLAFPLTYPCAATRLPLPPLAVNLQSCLILSGLTGHHRRRALALAPQDCFWRRRHGCRWGAPWMGWEQEEATRPTFQRSESFGVEVCFSVANGFQRWKNLERRLGVDPRGGGAWRGNGENMSSCHREGMLQVFIGGGLGEDDVHVLDQPPSLYVSVVPSPSSSRCQRFSYSHRQ